MPLEAKFPSNTAMARLLALNRVIADMAVREAAGYRSFYDRLRCKGLLGKELRHCVEFVA